MGKLFGADGIRAHIDQHPLTPVDATRLGQTIAAWQLESEIRPVFLLGTDTRESFQRLKNALIDGLIHGGVTVIDAGILPTAAVSNLIALKHTFTAGAMISASHNPLEENGIKIFDRQGIKISDEVEQHIEELYFGRTALPRQSRPAAHMIETHFTRQYVNALVQEFRHLNWQNQRVLIDCANGAAFEVVPLVLTKLNVPYNLINAAPNGININRQAGSEYVRQEPRHLVRETARVGATIGIALDGDADRVLLVDRHGRLYDGDILMAILALKYSREQALQQNTVVFTQMSNSGLIQYLHRHQLKSQQVRNGDKYITAALVDQHLTLGGEEIGHIIAHTDTTRVTGDGLRTALLVLSTLLQAVDAELYDLAPGMRKWPQINASIHLERRTDLPTKEIPGASTMLDNIRWKVPDLTRLECRPASTEAVYRIMLEAQVTNVSILANQAHQLGLHIQRCLGCPGRPIRILNCVTGGLVLPLPS